MRPETWCKQGNFSSSSGRRLGHAHEHSALRTEIKEYSLRYAQRLEKNSCATVCFSVCSVCRFPSAHACARKKCTPYFVFVLCTVQSITKRDCSSRALHTVCGRTAHSLHTNCTQTALNAVAQCIFCAPQVLVPKCLLFGRSIWPFPAQTWPNCAQSLGVVARAQPNGRAQTRRRRRRRRAAQSQKSAGTRRRPR